MEQILVVLLDLDFSACDDKLSVYETLNEVGNVDLILMVGLVFRLNISLERSQILKWIMT